MSFAQLGLSAPLLRVVDAMKYVEPTPVQAQAIPVVMQGRDVIALAETGSGKTAGYLLPIFEKLQHGKGLRALVVAPTRELALQIDGVAREIAEPLGLHVVTVIGGQRQRGQLDQLERGCDLLVATPGRLLDLEEQRHIRLGGVKHFVLDEADRLLDMGFLPDVRTIIRKLPRERQSMLFSATLSAEVEGLAYELSTDAVTIQIGKRTTTVTSVEQIAYGVMGHHKTPLLLRLADEVIDGQALIFTKTKRGADSLAHVLTVHGHSVETMHADRNQQQRTAALDKFKAGKVKFLVATDIAARGIDIDTIAFVINYDIPPTVEDYVHRVGRTARAGRKGVAITIHSPLEEGMMREIERVTGNQIERRKLDNFSDGQMDPSVAAFLANAAAARKPAGRPGGGGRFGGKRR